MVSQEKKKISFAYSTLRLIKNKLQFVCFVYFLFIYIYIYIYCFAYTYANCTTKYQLFSCFQILLGEHTYVSSVWPQSVRDLLGANGLVNSRSQVHSFKRKVSSKAFTPDALDSYLVAMKKITDEKVNSFLYCL